jgi:hypothetical protein
MKSEFDKKWIIENGVPIAKSYGGNITLRGLHYRLVAKGMINDVAHYKKVVTSMIDARWDGLLDFDDFKDHERETLGMTRYDLTDVESAVDEAKNQIKAWANSYRKNRWENQPIYPEVFIEKKALQGVFEDTCNKWGVALNPCKGYPSLTFQYDAKRRFDSAISAQKMPVILYFGDYDCSGEDIPRSIQDTLLRMGTQVELKRIALTEKQVVKWKLPPAPTKRGDSRAANWDGLGQVELDAVEPDKIISLLTDAIQSVFDEELYSDLRAIEEDEIDQFKAVIKRDFKKLLD